MSERGVRGRQRWQAPRAACLTALALLPALALVHLTRIEAAVAGAALAMVELTAAGLGALAIRAWRLATSTPEGPSHTPAAVRDVAAGLLAWGALVVATVLGESFARDTPREAGLALLADTGPVPFMALAAGAVWLWTIDAGDRKPKDG